MQEIISAAETFEKFVTQKESYIASMQEMYNKKCQQV